MLELEKKVVEQELEITKLRASGIVSRSEIVNDLDRKLISVGEKSSTLGEVFLGLADSLAVA